MKSVWEDTVTIRPRETLSSDIQTEVAVIGGGLSGILIAYLLKEQGIDVVVLEGNRIGMGVTKNTTAKITSAHDLFYDNAINTLGIYKSKQYATANEDAIKKYWELILHKGIDCDFENTEDYVYSLNNSEIIQKEVKAAQILGIDAEFTLDTELPFEVKGAVKFKNQAQFHPLKFINAIAEDLTIYENTKVIKIDEDYTLITDHAKVKAKRIVFATHYPIMNTPGYYFLRMHQERSYVIALKNVPPIKGMYIDESQNGYSFRGYQDLLLLGGGGHRTGENEQGGKYELLRNAAKNFYPQSKEVYFWSAQDCMSLDNIPYIGHYSNSTENIYVATGYKKWGMTSSMVAATMISDMICKKENENKEVFSPQRFNTKASYKNLKT